MKFLKISLCCIIVFVLFTANCFALSASTYADLAQSSTQVQNLISYAHSYNSFINSDFVVFQSGQYNYYIFWGDLNYNGSSVTASEAECISYYREGSGYDYQYRYSYDDSENLSLTVNNLVVSNVDELGSSSALYEEFKSYNRDKAFGIFILAVLIVIMFLAFRRTFK